MSAPLVVRVVGIVRGRDVDATAEVTLDHETVLLNWHHAAAWQLEFEGIEGIGTNASSLTLYLRDHDVLELAGSDAVRALGREIMDRACRVPELTRGLRQFGAPPRDGGAAGVTSALQTAHDLWFAPLFAARKAVHGVTDPERQVALMDGGALTDAMTEAAARIAALLAPGDAAEQRALEAAIEDEAAMLFRALARLHHAGATVRTGALDSRLADWRRWVAAAADAFAAADEAWGQVVEVLGEHG